MAVAALFAAAPAVAQNYGPQPGYGFPLGPSIVGTWSGQGSDSGGVIQKAEAYSEDGRFVSVARLPNGFPARVWGIYRTTPVSANQLRLESRLERWLPSEVCQQVAGGMPQCQPVQLPATDISLVTFSSPGQFQSMSETQAGATTNEQRDSQPALLGAQAPQRWVTITQPSPAPLPGYMPAPTTIGRSYSPVPTQSRNPCPNDDIQTNICKYSGRLVTTGGCLRCIGG